MKEILQELLRVEAQAKQVVADAEAEARKVVADAAAQGQKQVAQAHLGAVEEAQRLVAQRAAEARAQKQAQLEAGRPARLAAAAVPAPVAADAVDLVCRAVMGIGNAVSRH
jgi:vacuolar-type H+-ATPase subunit H